MSQQRREARTGRLVVPSLTGPAVTAHELCNVLGAVQLRFGVLESDPTCRWAQEENLAAIRALLKRGMELARVVEGTTVPGPAAGRSQRAVTPRRR